MFIWGVPALHSVRLLHPDLHLISYTLRYLALLPVCSIIICDSCFISGSVPFFCANYISDTYKMLYDICSKTIQCSISNIYQLEGTTIK